MDVDVDYMFFLAMTAAAGAYPNKFASPIGMIKAGRLCLDFALSGVQNFADSDLNQRACFKLT